MVGSSKLIFYFYFRLYNFFNFKFNPYKDKKKKEIYKFLFYFRPINLRFIYLCLFSVYHFVTVADG